MPWADDTSGNRSKQYNAHLNLCTQNLNIPHKQLKHQYFVQFCSTSQHASSGEQFSPLIETLSGFAPFRILPFGCSRPFWTSFPPQLLSCMLRLVLTTSASMVSSALSVLALLSIGLVVITSDLPYLPSPNPFLSYLFLYLIAPHYL